MASAVPLNPLQNLTELRAEFERVWPWLWASLCEFGPTHNKEQVWITLCLRRGHLWSTQNCAVIGIFMNWPIGLRDFNYWLQGGDLAQLKTMHDGIEAWASAQGANRITGLGRDGWARAMGKNWQKGPTMRQKWLTKPPSHSSSAT